MFSALNREELISGLLLPRPGPFASYPSGPCLLYDKPVLSAANSGIPDETCAGNCASSNGFDEDGPGVAPVSRFDDTEDTAGIIPSCQVDGTEDAADIAPLPHVDDSVDTFNYVPMSPPEDQTDKSNAYKPEQSLVKIQRSRSRQKALELRNSAKTSAKSRLGMENSNICRNDEQLGLRRSLELAEPSALPTEICSNEKVAIGNFLNKELSADGYAGFLAQSTGFAPEICSKEEVATGYHSDKKKFFDTSGGSFTHSTVHEGNEVELADNQMIEECSNIYGGRFTRSRSSGQSSVEGAHSLNKRTMDVCVAPMTRSKSFQGAHPLNKKNVDVCVGPIMRSESVEGAHPLNKKSMDVCVSRIVRSKSGLTQQVESSIGNSIKAHSGIFMRSKSRAEEAERFQRSMSKKVSVKPKQLDFDEVEERKFLGNLPDHLPGPISLDTLEERTRAHTINTSSSLPGAVSIGAYPQSLAYKTLEVPGSEIAHALSKSDKISGQTLILQDCVGGLQSSLDAEATEVAQLSPDQTPVGLLVPVTDFAPTVTRDEAKADSAQSAKIVKLGSLSTSAAVRASSSSHGKQAGDSELCELRAEVNMLQAFNYSNALDGSWPCYKRRKIDYQNPNKSCSPTLRVNSFRAISENIPDRCDWGEKENIHPVSQKSINSHNSGAALSECTILAKETGQSVSSSTSKEHSLTHQVECGKVLVHPRYSLLAL